MVKSANPTRRYEYKYVIIDDNSPEPLETAVWQYGNNRVLALQLSLHDEVVLVEVVDSWVPNPKSMPIMLHHLDGKVTEAGLALYMSTSFTHVIFASKHGSI